MPFRFAGGATEAGSHSAAGLQRPPEGCLPIDDTFLCGATCPYCYHALNDLFNHPAGFHNAVVLVCPEANEGKEGQYWVSKTSVRQRPAAAAKPKAKPKKNKTKAAPEEGAAEEAGAS